MGFFSKLKKIVKKGFSGVKKVVKKIGKTVKKAVKGIGKFMGKIGIVGQIAMSFILPGIGGALMKGVGGFVGKMAASASPFISGAGKVLQAAGNFAKAGHSAFKTVTEGIGSFVKEFTGTALKKIPGADKIFPSLEKAPDSFFKGKDSAWSKVSDNVMKNGNEVLANFDKAIGKGTSTAVSKTGSTAAKTITVKDATVSAKDMGAGPETFKADKFTHDDIVMKKSTIGEVAPERSLLERGKDYMGELADRSVEAVKTIPDKILDMPDKLVREIDESVSEGVTSAVTTKVLQETNLVEKPEYTTIYEGSTNVAPIEMPTPGFYSSPEINDRAYQMSVNPTGFTSSNPWGNPANTYQQELGARYG